MRRLRFTLAEIRHHPQRLIGVAIAVVLSVAFLTSSMVLVSTEQNSLQSALVAPYARSDVVIQADAGSSDGPPAQPAKVAEVVATLRQVRGVAAAEPLWQGYAQASVPNATFSLSSVGTDPRFRWPELAGGNWPRDPGEATLSNDTARRLGLAVGDSVTLGDERALTVRITGLVDTRQSLLSGLTNQLFLTPTDLAKHPNLGGSPSYLVAAQPGVDPAALSGQVRTAFQRVSPGDSTVQPTSELAATTLRELTGGFAVFGTLLLGFAVIAMLVTTIIIANTFQIIVAQRQRQIGLLRIVGAGSDRVARDLLTESVVVGVLSSLLGVAAGIGLGAAATAATGSLAWGLHVPVGLLLLAALFGTVITVVGAFGPSRRAMAVSPMAALRPPTGSDGRRTSRARGIAAALLVGVGLAVIVPSMTLVTGTGSLLLAIAGSFLVALGVLLAAGFVIPPTIRLLGGVAARFGAPGKLAVANALRNPSRSTATGVALMLAIGLVVTLQVGAASVTASASAQLDSNYPVDLVAGLYDTSVSAARADRIRALDGVAAAELVPTRSIGVGGNGYQAVALRPDTAVVATGLQQLDDTHVLAHPATAKEAGWKQGEQLTLATDQGDSVSNATLAFSSAAPSGVLIVTPALLAKVAAAAPGAPSRDQLWIALTDRADVAAVVNAVQQEVGSEGWVDGAAVSRQLMQNVLNVLVGIASGLMGVAVLIALIGVGNTVSLSVVERARELALLRALGLQRRQLRLSLVIECVLLALAGSLVGILAGIGFGWLGTAAIMRSSGQEAIRLAVSGPTTLAVALVAIVAGALAALPPARQALKASPAEVLADE